MLPSFFVSDLHGRLNRYQSLFKLISQERPRGVFLGGDMLPHAMDRAWCSSAPKKDFVLDYLIPEFQKLKNNLGDNYPRVFLILGNDDPRAFEEDLLEGQNQGLWEYIHADKREFGPFTVYGYSCIPPSPFLLKDWERYDVSMFVDPGCISPEEGRRTAGPVGREIHFTTISAELEQLAGTDNLKNALFLFHCPPYKCKLDRADLDGKFIENVPLDVHIGSIAIERFIADRQPLLTLHGHVHESRTLTGSWQDKFGRTIAMSAANEGPELALVRFDPYHPELATLELI